MSEDTPLISIYRKIESVVKKGHKVHYTICGLARDIKKEGTFSHFHYSGWRRTPHAIFKEGGSAKLWEIDEIKNIIGRVVYRAEE